MEKLGEVAQTDDGCISTMAFRTLLSVNKIRPTLKLIVNHASCE